jgi:hypothetical protein
LCSALPTYSTRWATSAAGSTDGQRTIFFGVMLRFFFTRAERSSSIRFTWF